MRASARRARISVHGGRFPGSDVQGSVSISGSIWVAGPEAPLYWLARLRV